MTTATTQQTVLCRLAYPTEGPLVKMLFTKYYEEPCDWLRWDNVFPHWILAEYGGESVGIAMLGIGSPFGWIEFLMVDPTLSKTMKGRAVSAIETYAYDALKAFGISGVLSTVSNTKPNFQQIMTRRGFVPHGSCTIYLKRL